MILREMQAEEARGLQLLALKNFWRSLESPYVTKPKMAMLAEKDGKIIGGFLYSIENSGKNKLGFVDFFFVDSQHMGQGVGSALCKEGIARMWAQGCDYLITVVRDDNVGSWASFEKMGFVRANLLKFTRAVGFGGLIRAYLSHSYGVSVGCNLYFAARSENSEVYAKDFGLGQMFLHLVINIALALLSFSVIIFESLPQLILSLALVFGGVILFAYIGTLFSKRSWRYQFTTGGAVLSLILPLGGGVFPLAGGFYPKRYENTEKFRRDMAITAILPWVFLMALLLIVQFFDFGFLYSGLIAGITRALLLFRCIPLLSANFGASRIYKWRQDLWFMMVVASVTMVMWF